MMRIIEWIEGESEIVLDVLIIHTLAAARRNVRGAALVAILPMVIIIITADHQQSLSQRPPSLGCAVIWPGNIMNCRYRSPSQQHRSYQCGTGSI